MLKWDLESKVDSFTGGCIKSFYDRWADLTSDPEILATVTGLPIDIWEIPQSTKIQYPLGQEERKFVVHELDRLLGKGVIEKCQHEVGELISPIFILEKSDGDGFRMILNLKKLNEVSDYEHFKMDTFKIVLNLIYPGGVHGQAGH